MNDARQMYYEHLVEARQQAYADYDKTLVALAGGAFGVSALFILQ